MHNIYECANAFTSLLDTEYEIVLGRKGSAVTLRVCFDEKDCFHLMVLQYLTDRPELNRDRGKIFNDIKEHRITLEQIETSDFYYKIESRIDVLPYLEKLFDSNDIIFKYNRKINSFSLIQADYLMKNQLQNKTIFIFLSRNQSGKYYCRSFFPENKVDYSEGQASWTLLFKKKIQVSTGKEIVLYDKLRTK